MNKKKQIAEMQKIMENCCNVYNDKGTLISNKCNSFDCVYYDDTNDVCCSFNKKQAIALYEAGYRKIPEGAVLLTGEEFENFGKDCKNCPYALDWYKETLRKETAREILQYFFDWLDFDELSPTGFIHIMRQDFERRLNDFSKKYGVEVE